MNKKKSTLNKRVQSFKTSKNFYESLNYAYSGIVYCFKYSRNFRIQILCSLITIFLGRLLKLNGIESIVILAKKAFYLIHYYHDDPIQVSVKSHD